MLTGLPEVLPTLEEQPIVVPPPSDEDDGDPLLLEHPPVGPSKITPTVSPEAIAVRAPRALSFVSLRDDTVAMFIKTYTSIGPKSGGLEVP